MTRIIQDDTAAVARIAIEQALGRADSVTAVVRLDRALRDLTPTNPTEHQVSMAGGDGEPYEMCCSTCPGHPDILCTGARNHAGAHHAPGHNAAGTGGYSWDWEPRTEDYTVTELFPVQPDGFTTDYCEDCGVRVYGRHQRLHTTWHNKLLP